MTDPDRNCFSSKASSQLQDGHGSPAYKKSDKATPTDFPGSTHKCRRPQYDMSGDRLMYIFNHKDYQEDSPYYYPYTPGTRDGTQHDVTKLCKVFSTLNFKVTDPYDNYTRAQIRTTVKHICSLDHSNTSCLAIAILTHGHENEIVLAADRPYYLSDVVNEVLKVKSLAGKPKLFFVQACRGKLGDAGIQTDGKDFNSNIPTHSDVLILKANYEGFVSFRSPSTGSWMIQSLCDIINQYHKEKDILHMLTMVNNIVAAKLSNTYNEEYDKKKQIPVVRFTLRKLLKF